MMKNWEGEINNLENVLRKLLSCDLDSVLISVDYIESKMVNL